MEKQEITITLKGSTVDHFEYLFNASREVLKARALGIKVEFDSSFVQEKCEKWAKQQFKSKKEGLRKAALQYAGELMQRGVSKEDAYKRAGIVSTSAPVATIAHVAGK